MDSNWSYIFLGKMNTARSHVVLDTPVPILTLKLSNISHNNTWMGDRLGTSGVASMGSDIDTA